VAELKPGAHRAAGGTAPAVGAGPDGTSVARVTLQDVANRAGVSLSTASRVVNEGSRRVGPGLADRVTRAVADLGYLANLQARAVATGQSSMMGVTVHDIADPYFSSIAAGLIEAGRAGGLLTCVSSAPPGEAGELEYVSLMRAQRARAVVLVGSRSAGAGATAALRAGVAAFARDGGRAVCVGQDLLGIDTILPGNAEGAQALAGALVALGHQRFAVLAGPESLVTARDRVQGFGAGLGSWSVGLDPRRVVHGAFTRDGGYEAMSAILASGGTRPDCVFAVNDDISTLRDIYPPLTTVRLPLRQMGEMAARLVLQEADQPRVIPVPGEVILRDSTAPRPGRR
jgi:LacI family transcriptional regulator